jgi:hypothetical protein
MTTTTARTLAVEMKARRAELGLSVAEAADRAEMSRSNWFAIEGAQRDRITTRSLRGIDRALDWPIGQAGAFYAHTDPPASWDDVWAGAPWTHFVDDPDELRSLRREIKADIDLIIEVGPMLRLAVEVKRTVLAQAEIRSHVARIARERLNRVGGPEVPDELQAASEGR